METNGILLISNEKVDQFFAKEVAHFAQCSFLQVANAQEGAAAIQSQPHQIIFADISSSEQASAFQTHFTPLLSQKNSPSGAPRMSCNRAHCINNFEYSQPLAALIDQDFFGHFISRSFSDPVTEGRHYSRVVKNTLLRKQPHLGATPPTQGDIRVVKLSTSRDKEKTLEILNDYMIQQTTFRGRMVNSIVTAVDELLMNAIYDAPSEYRHGSTPNQPQDGTATQNVKRPPVELQMGFDGEYVSFTVVDRYGSLNRKKLLMKIFRDRGNVDSTTPNNLGSSEIAHEGAGIGLSMTLHNGGSLLFVCEPRVQTEVTVFFRHSRSFREFKNQFRFVSVIQ